MTSVISLGILGDLIKESRELLQVCSEFTSVFVVCSTNAGEGLVTLAV